MRKAPIALVSLAALTLTACVPGPRPSPNGLERGETLSLTSAQLSLLIEGVDWRAPEQRWRPALAG